MSAVLESVATPISQARAALDAARGELAACDERIRGYEGELDEREIERERHVVAVKTAVAQNRVLPKPPKVKPSDADVALPVLRGQRVKLTERVTECEGLLRRAVVQDVQQRKAEALSHFAETTSKEIAALLKLLALQALLEQAGVRSEPLPGSLYSDFSVPAVGRLRPICEHHAMHFLASHAIAQGELGRATHAARAEIEGDIGMKLPW